MSSHNLSDMPGIDIKSKKDALLHDGGATSRKLWLTVFAMILIVGTGVLAGLTVFSGLATQLSVIVGGILGALGIYAGANVSTKFAAAGVRKAKAAAAAPKPTITKPTATKPAAKPPLERG